MRGSEVTSTVRPPVYSSSTRICACVANPAAAAGPPGATNSAAWPGTPCIWPLASVLVIVKVADNALGRETLTNTPPSASVGRCCVLFVVGGASVGQTRCGHLSQWAVPSPPSQRACEKNKNKSRLII